MKTLIVEKNDIVDSIPSDVEKLIWKKETSILTIPKNLKYLEANSLVSIKYLPDTLETLIVNRVKLLPRQLPKKLKYLEANSLVSISNLPSKLIDLHTAKLGWFFDDRNWLSKLLFNFFPSSLETLVVGEIKKWPSMPKGCIVSLYGKSKYFEEVLPKLKLNNTVLTFFNN